MTNSNKRTLLLAVTMITAVGVWLIPPIAQPLYYHDLADKRIIWGIPNFTNVMSNLPFIVVGLSGLLAMRRVHVGAGLAVAYGVLFSAIILTGIGSGYYHWRPNNDTLVWDRIPMTLVFMSLSATTVAEVVDYRVGVSLLWPLLALGVASVWWWHMTELRGHGDLRLYGWVQYYPLLFVPLVLLLYYHPSHRRTLKPLIWVVVWYVVAKMCEHLDKAIFGAIGIGGHALKHIAAAVATLWLVVLFLRKHGRSSTAISQG